MADELGLSFEEVAEEYDRVRPGYPEELLDTALELAGLGPGSPVLEVGPGTGKLTRLLVDRGVAVDAVEPGTEMAAVARRHVGDAVRFHGGRFEDVELPDDAYDALFSATAWHWVDPVVGWAKAARVLRPGGTLALLSHFGGSRTELDLAILAAWREVQPDAVSWEYRTREELWAGANDRLANVSELWSWLSRHELAVPEAAELFGPARVDVVEYELTESADEYVGQVRTQSQYLRLDPERRARIETLLREVIADAGGAYRATVFATLVTARAS
jgi:SAM-dependent methyltransferase